MSSPICQPFEDKRASEGMGNHSLLAELYCAPLKLQSASCRHVDAADNFSTMSLMCAQWNNPLPLLAHSVGRANHREGVFAWRHGWEGFLEALASRGLDKRGKQEQRRNTLTMTCL